MGSYLYALREIRRRKYRTAGNIAGFVMAVAALITLVTAARGWEACTAAPMKAIGTDIILIYSAPIAPSREGCFIANHLFAYPFNQTEIAKIADVSGVERAVPILMHRRSAVVFTGIDPSETETNAVLPNAVVEGRYLGPDDGHVVLIDRENAQLNNLTVGSTIEYIKSFEVVGIVDVGATDLIKSHIYVNLPVAREVLPGSNEGLANVALIRVSDPRKVDVTAEALTNDLPGATTITSSDMATIASGVINMGEATAWNISIVLSVVAILFTIKSQLGVVAERKREIGILKAIGWSNSDVVKQIVIESALKGVIGGVLGCVFGYGFAWYVLYTMGGELGGALSFIAIDPILLTIGFGISVIGGITAGLYPSWKAARLTPAEALRTI
ncbi:MAG: ABC transporter permease [Candidatus Bathyarchaeota archaeon]|nr:MAG: ABC transporter permease [Candidatus Bathyarchaeota archaeon]